MYTTVLSTLLFASVALKGALAADPTINIPTLTQCKPASISWTQTKGPYNLIVVPAADPCSEVLADLGDHTDTSMTWTVNIKAGTVVTLSMEDANTNEVWSGDVTVQGSDDASCLNNLAVASGTASHSASGLVQAAGPIATVAGTIANAGSAPSTTGKPDVAGVGAAGNGIVAAGNGAGARVAGGAFALAGAFVAGLALTL